MLKKEVKTHRVAVIGSRNFNDKKFIYDYLDSKIDKIGHLVSGGCKLGADAICEQYARDRGLSITIHFPRWDAEGKAAGFNRNTTIVEDSQILIAFNSGSNGTQDSINKAKKLGKKVVEIKVQPDAKR